MPLSAIFHIKMSCRNMLTPREEVAKGGDFFVPDLCQLYIKIGQNSSKLVVIEGVEEAN